MLPDQEKNVKIREKIRETLLRRKSEEARTYELEFVRERIF